MAENYTNIPAMILAGGPTPEALQKVTQEKERSFIQLAGKPMVLRTVNSIKKNIFLSSLTLIGNVDRLKELFEDDDFNYLEDAGSLLDNLMQGLRSLEQHRRVLILTSDIPLITADIIASTLLECQKVDAECYYPIVSKSIIEKKFPGGKRTYIPLKEGQFSGANVFLVSPKALLRNEDLFRRLIRDRKSIPKLVGFLGFPFLLRLMTGMLDIPLLEKKGSQVLGVTVKAIISPNPEIAVDVDKESDFLIVTRFLERKKEIDNRVNDNNNNNN